MPFLDPDEGLYATIAQEMLTGGDWVIPHINGLPYLEKPPLFFSLTGLTLWLVGPSEWATRLWSALPALGTVILTWRIGRRLYGARAGLLAGLVLATVVGNALYVRKASTDELFVFCITLAMYGFLRDAERPGRGRARFLLFYLGAALGVLAKGFTGVVFPLLISRARDGRGAPALLARSQSGPWRGALRGGRRAVAHARGLALGDAVRVLRRGQPPPSVSRRARVRRGRRAELDARLPRRQLSLGLSLERLHPGAPGAGRLTPRALASGHRDLATRRRRAFRALTLQAR